MMPISNPLSLIHIKTKKPSYLPFPKEGDTTLGAEIKRRRLALEWTQEDTAKYFGILKDSCQKWEWNQVVPDIGNRKKVIEFLGFNYWDDGSFSLGNMVLLYRIEHGLTRRELAHQIGISDSSIGRIEKKICVVSKIIKGKVSKYINLQTDF